MTGFFRGVESINCVLLFRKELKQENEHGRVKKTWDIFFKCEKCKKQTKKNNKKTKKNDRSPNNDFFTAN